MAETKPHWDRKLFACQDDEGGLLKCLFAGFCPPCALASARKNYDRSNWIFNCCCVTTPIARSIMRENSEIDGNCCQDIVISCFCYPCAIAQMYAQAPSPAKENDPTGSWSQGLCSCCNNCGDCCYTFCFPSCAMATARTNFDRSNCCFNYCCLALPLARNIIRENSDIKGSCVEDICVSCWCPCCVTIQLLAQARHKNEKPRVVVQQIVQPVAVVGGQPVAFVGGQPVVGQQPVVYVHGPQSQMQQGSYAIVPQVSDQPQPQAVGGAQALTQVQMVHQVQEGGGAQPGGQVPTSDPI